MVDACIDYHLSMEVKLAREAIFNREDGNEKQTNFPQKLEFKPLFDTFAESWN